MFNPDSVVKLLLRILNALLSLDDKVSKILDHTTNMPQPLGQERWLDSADLKQLYNLSDSTIYRLAKRNILHPKMVGKRKYFKESEVLQYARVLLRRIRD
jgi:predicted DNA-binding transcriptional regulator AlpA